MTGQMKHSIPLPLAVEAVVIDLDGTLLHTAPDLAEAANRLLAVLQHPPIAQNLIETFVGNGVSRLIKRVLTREMDGEPDAALFARAQPVYEKHYAEVVSLNSRPYPDVVAGLQAFKQCINNLGTGPVMLYGNLVIIIF